MMDNRDRIRHDKSRYERPTLGWQCGRASLWGKPCPRGPSASGACGGTSACLPAQNGNNWQCRRPPAEGGPCANGPDAEGRCGLSQPPCAPRPTLRVWRGRLAFLATGLAIALIALFASTDSMRSMQVSSLDPGDLSAAHAHFVGEAGCGACHQAHGQGITGWWQAAFGSAQKPLSSSCLDCHGFGGMERQAHNRVFDARADLKTTDCLMCHTEHKGGSAPPSSVSDAQCQTCHGQKIQDFAQDHPPFPPGFPHDHPKGIRFNHASHLGTHFADPRLAAQVPVGGCTGCHTIETAARAIRPAGFDTTCAGCHADSITRREFVLFRWPELEAADIPAADVARACSLNAPKTAAVETSLDPAGFSAVSLDYPTPLQAFLLGKTADDAADYGPAVQDLAKEALSDGADPLVDLIAERLGVPASRKLVAGLNGEQVRQAFCAWAANSEYEPTGTSELPGWQADALDLRYVRPGHADPVLHAWLDAVAGLPTPADPDEADRLQEARDDMLSAANSPGQCLKCHAVNEAADGSKRISWSHTLGESREARKLTRFDHQPHINLLGPDKSCTNCHQLATAAAGGDASFTPVAVAGCANCHAEGRLRDDCLLCHAYHQDHALKKGMMANGN